MRTYLHYITSLIHTLPVDVKWCWLTTTTGEVRSLRGSRSLASGAVQFSGPCLGLCLCVCCVLLLGARCSVEKCDVTHYDVPSPRERGKGSPSLCIASVAALLLCIAVSGAFPFRLLGSTSGSASIRILSLSPGSITHSIGSCREYMYLFGLQR